MKNTNKRFLSLLLTILLLLGTVAFGFSAAAKDADYNWQSIPTSPEGLAEGEWYMDFTDYNSAMNLLLSSTHPTAADTWYFDEAKMALKAEGCIPQGSTLYEDGVYKQYPDTMVKLSPDKNPVSMQFFVYRFLTRVGQSWALAEYTMKGSSGAFYYNNIRIDFDVLAERLVTDDDTLTQEDIPALKEALCCGEWMVDQNLNLLKGCYLLPEDLTQSGREEARFVLPSQAYYESCVGAPLREQDFSHMSGQWNDNINWTLENGVLTVSGTGKMETQEEREYNSGHLRLYFSADTVEYYGGYGTSSRRLLEREMEESALAHFGVENGLQLLAAIARGRVDMKDYIDYYYQQTIGFVKTIIIEDGITAIGKDVFRALHPETIMLPASLKSIDYNPYDTYNKESAFDLSATKHIYFLDAASDFESLRLGIEGVAESCAFLYEDSSMLLDWRLVESMDDGDAWLRENAFEFLSETALQEFCKNAYDIMSSPIGKLPTKEMIVDAWNRQTGDNYTSGDTLLADLIAWFNNRFGTQFTSVTEFFLHPPGLSTYSLQRSEAYEAAYDSYYDEMQQQAVESVGLTDATALTVWENAWFGNAFKTSESGEAIVAAPWLTIHGYVGSTAETAAAASGVRFAPLCSSDPTHDVTEKETAPTCTEAGHSKGWYCKDCGTWLTGEAIDPTGHTPGSPVREYPIPPTCIVHGGYDDVIYCMQCGCEINRTHEVIDAVGHAWGEWTVVKAPTTNVEGMEQRVCTNDTSHVETRTLAKLPQSDNGGNDNNSDDDDGGFFGWIQRAMKGLVAWFKKLLSFFSR